MDISAARAGALTALTRAKAWMSDLDPADMGNGYPSIKEDALLGKRLAAARVLGLSAARVPALPIRRYS